MIRFTCSFIIILLSLTTLVVSVEKIQLFSYQKVVNWPYKIPPIVAIIGIFLGLKIWRPTSWLKHPVSKQRWQRFKQLKRGYYSFIIVGIIFLLACCNQIIVGNKALWLSYEGKWYFPAFVKKQFKGKDFGLQGAAADTPVNYRLLQKKWQANDSTNTLIMPIIAYAATEDMIASREQLLLQDDAGRYLDPYSNKPFNGIGYRLYPNSDNYELNNRKEFAKYKLRKGKKHGPVFGKNKQQEIIYKGHYQEGKLTTEKYFGNQDVTWYQQQASPNLYAIYYSPAPPYIASGNYLGTHSDGGDIVAGLFAGLQLNFIACLFFIPCIYIIGVIIGLLMGYLGKWFDLIMQRIIEIISNIPFLFVVLIIVSSLQNITVNLSILLALLIIFGWLGMTYLMRTLSYKEKVKDYVAASQVMGASTFHIIRQHILPNSVALLVTLIPFSVSSIILSLTSLDYLGFGLPKDKYMTWGHLLSDALENLNAPWIVFSVFIVLVTTLTLVTFIGEAIREAFDPKKFVTYH